MYQNLFDSHTHSENSLDANHSVTFMVEIAVEKGIQGLSVTDHCDCDCIEKYNYDLRQRQSALDTAIARAAFHNRMIITSGIELGQPQLDFESAERILGMQYYDFVLLAIHKIRGWNDFYEINYAELSRQELSRLMHQYFDELLEAVKWGNFDSLAHMSLPLRYLKRHNGIDVDLTCYADEIDSVLRVLACTGKALELNTSGLRGNLGDTMPPIWIARRFKELGGEMVTIGSDAHRVDDIGEGVQDGMRLLREAGFEYFTFFRDRKPVMLRII